MIPSVVVSITNAPVIGMLDTIFVYDKYCTKYMSINISDINCYI